MVEATGKAAVVPQLHDLGSSSWLPEEEGPGMIPFLEGGAWVSQAAICSGSLSTCKAAGSESWPCGSRTSALSFWSSQSLNLNISEKVLGEADAHFVLLPLLASLCTHGFTFEGQFPFALTYLRGHWTDLCQQACGGPGWPWGAAWPSGDLRFHCGGAVQGAGARPGLGEREARWGPLQGLKSLLRRFCHIYIPPLLFT